MKQCENLNEVVAYIHSRHRKINITQHGVHGFKLLRKPDGQRILFEQIKGFRIFKIQAFEPDMLIVDTLASGFTFKNNEKVIVSARTFLTDLAVINLYDHRAEFFSRSSIDFAYVEADYGVELEMLTEWVNRDPGVMRAQWLAKDEHVDRILEELSGGRKSQMQLSTEQPRFIHLTEG